MTRYTKRLLFASAAVLCGVPFHAQALDGVSKDVPSAVCRQFLAPHLATAAVSLTHGKFEAGGEDGAQPELNASSPENRKKWEKSVKAGSAWAAYNWSQRDGTNIVTVQYAFETDSSCDVFPVEPTRISPIYLPQTVARYLVRQQGDDGKGDLKTLRGKVQHILSEWNANPSPDENDSYHDNDTAGVTTTANSTEPMTFNGTQMSMLKGTCDKLVVGVQNYTSRCTGDLMSTAYPDRRVGFYFSTGENQLFTFSGMDGENPSKDTDVTFIDKVIINLQGQESTALDYKASGKCIYGNAFSGEPMTIVCSGKTADDMPFSAIFTTDGSPPR